MAERPNATVCKTVKPQVQILLGAPINISMNALPKVAIFVHHPLCSIQSVNGIITSLFPHYECKIFTKHEIDDTYLDDIDIVCFPGGLGDSDRFDVILDRHVDAIRSYVKKGGRYLGICLGAYWADSYYFDILDTGTRVEQYIRRPNTDTRRPHAKGQLVSWQGKVERMYFYDGCAITGNNLDVVATYSNGDPMAVIQGKVGLIGCHPESQKSWYDYYTWMPRHWHYRHHNKLLLDFVNLLMQK
jgi:glutamine amidotransferase-like uncharacterized protein